MKLDNLFKRQTFLITGSIVLLLVVFAGLSFAFFTKVLKSESDIVVKSGDLEIVFSGDGTITGDFVPMSDTDGMDEDGYTFTVNNTGTLNVTYKVEIYPDTSVGGTAIPHQYLMVSFNNGTAQQLSLVTKTTTGADESGNVYYLGTDNVDRKDSKQNTIKLWIKEDAPETIIGNKVAFKVKVTSEVNKGNDNPVGTQPYKCVRATTLHTETCQQNDSTGYCSATGSIGNGNTITYGQLGTAGTLAAGDAFTCDVNGDGIYNEETERFYYVSDLYTGTTENVDQFDISTAVLIYYNNTTNGVSDNTSASLIAYNEVNVNNLGPVTAIANLPSTTQWSNVSLKDQTRQIRTLTGTTSTEAGEISPFTYTDKSARLITAQEIRNGCGNSNVLSTDGYLDSLTCRFLMENTKYSNSSNGTFGIWTETPHSENSSCIWSSYANNRYINWDHSEKIVNYGTRPAIEVAKKDIKY